MSLRLCNTKKADKERPLKKIDLIGSALGNLYNIRAIANLLTAFLEQIEPGDQVPISSETLIANCYLLGDLAEKAIGILDNPGVIH